MSAPTAAAAKTERLLNLVIALLYTRRPLAKSRIRDAVPQYAAASTTEAFDRMFERDKDELRALGIPLVTEPLDPVFDDEPGYRIDRREYALPEIAFAPQEMAALALASRVWSSASLAGPAALALRKLEAAGVVRDETALAGLEPRVQTVEPAFEAVRAAVQALQPIQFSYRASSTGQVAVRHVRPWGLASWRGRWYLTGFDVDRDDARVFRLSRVEGRVRPVGAAGSYAVPPGHQPRQMIRTMMPPGEPTPATLLVRDGAGHTLRRRAVTVEAAEPGWTRLEVLFAEPEYIADEVAGFGPDAVVLAPPALRDAVTARLRGAAQKGPAAG
ncbi:MAG TPA: WYL domain-containing protein [Dermatophilaceae bacterium]|nr:WYL domain-containing protein [Dermatophilaceae bacterium]